MEDNTTLQDSQLRQPKKRFVGRRTADAQAQNDSTGQGDLESTAVQKGMQNLPVISEAVANSIYRSCAEAHTSHIESSAA